MAAQFGCLAWMLTACMSAGRSNPAPVEDRVKPKSQAAAKPSPDGAKAAKATPGSVQDTPSGYYTVKPGDTLIRIGLDHGQNWRDIIRWNNIENPNLIEVGQVLRVAPPQGEPEAVVVKPVTRSGTTPTEKDLPASGNAASSTQSNATQEHADDPVGFSWPAAGSMQSGFDESKNKGIDIVGKAGDPVWAAADGRVVYAGAGLRGYGNLIILKHSNQFLTAYAHNQVLLVREDQSVKKGQKIAEMGNSDAEQVKLHFEIRKQGKPVDPMKFLPAR